MIFNLIIEVLIDLIIDVLIDLGHVVTLINVRLKVLYPMARMAVRETIDLLLKLISTPHRPFSPHHITATLLQPLDGRGGEGLKSDRE